jgi:hypothetical protein
MREIITKRNIYTGNKRRVEHEDYAKSNGVYDILFFTSFHILWLGPYELGSRLIIEKR